MPLPVVTDGIYGAYRFVLAGAQSAEWTFALTTGETDMESLADDLQALWAEELAAQIHENCQLASVALTPLDGTSATTVFPTEVAGGNNSGTMVSDSVCMVCTFRTGTAGRSFRGRAYIPGLSTDSFQNQYQWSASQAAELGTRFAAWNSALAARAVPCTHGVLSRVESVITAVSSYQGRVGIATQRRRLTGGVIF